MLGVCARDLFLIRLCAGAPVRAMPLRDILGFLFTQLGHGGAKRKQHME